MKQVDFNKLIAFLNTYYPREYSKDELIAIKNELNDYTYDDFEKELKDDLLNRVDYFTAQALHKLISEKKIDKNYSNANLNSCYWYEIEREWCEKNNVPYYDITKGPDYPLPPFKD